MIKSAEFIAERLPSISTAEAESSPPQIFVDSRELAVKTSVCLVTNVTA
jgi:hypothetical protein